MMFVMTTGSMNTNEFFVAGLGFMSIPAYTESNSGMSGGGTGFAVMGIPIGIIGVNNINSKVVNRGRSRTDMQTLGQR